MRALAFLTVSIWMVASPSAQRAAITEYVEEQQARQRKTLGLKETG